MPSLSQIKVSRSSNWTYYVQKRLFEGARLCDLLNVWRCMHMCVHTCVNNAHASPAFTLQLCSSCKRLRFREKLFSLNSCLRAILVNAWMQGYRGWEMPLAGVGAVSVHLRNRKGTDMCTFRRCCCANTLVCPCPLGSACVCTSVGVWGEDRRFAMCLKHCGSLWSLEYECVYTCKNTCVGVYICN